MVFNKTFIIDVNISSFLSAVLNDYPSFSTVNDIRVQFIDWFSQYGVRAPPKRELNPNWPHFVPLKPVPHTVDELLELIPSEEDGDVPVWVVFEDSLSILGREVSDHFCCFTS